ncbi:hypothetical protein [Paraliomyxa miuraensis]|uniref:hypothetical protein n=1 Tax=Paraliomyxa miuraensis TaxID=376150 RepID=UPI002254661F|nr:hypothetical protein [Paraliomyxa miuraensis]MCX4239466.1 hypothetical protein [Paraliomyxa miuraensis]
MNLRKLPPSMLLALGLACGDKGDGGDTTTVNACLSPPGPETATGPCLDVESCLSETTGFSTNDGTSTSTGGSGSGSGGDSTFGPCLSPEPPTDSGTGSDTDAGTDTGTGSGTGTSGMMGDEPPTTRAAAVGRVLDRGALPGDVAARLQRVLDRNRE